jgi:hypothetical protein
MVASDLGGIVYALHVIEEDPELHVVDVPERISRAHHVGYAAADGEHQLVRRFTAHPLGCLLQAIQRHRHHREGAIRTAGPSPHRHLDSIEQQRVRRESGETVIHEITGRLLVSRTEVRDVAQRPGDPICLPCLVMHGDTAGDDMSIRPVPVQHPVLALEPL